MANEDKKPQASKPQPAQDAAQKTKEKEAPVETKADKFRRLANRRIAKARSAIAAMEPLANERNYTRTQEQSAKIIDALSKAVARVKAAYDNAKPEETADMI